MVSASVKTETIAMTSDVICSWWMRGEFAEQRGDWQTNASLDIPGADLLGQEASTQAMQATPLTPPNVDYEVRSVYDSRPINAYDFNFSAATEFTSPPDPGTIATWEATFTVPTGYRAVPRDWDVFFDTPPNVIASKSTVTLQQQGAAVPNNGPMIIGMGTGPTPIKSFFICEENTTFGIQGSINVGVNSTQSSTISINVHGNLIPVTDCALPFTIADQLKNPTLVNKLLNPGSSL
jgi:hypothetical protein